MLPNRQFVSHSWNVQSAQMMELSAGNSGGPAFSDLEKGIIGGVAFSKLTHAGKPSL